MLSLTGITKEYLAGNTKVEALKGIDLYFRKNEFVCILGPSGCGKTTMLNILGGLDRYTSGDLVINGKSTKNFTDRDWDTYRNRSIGFVFQSYNLIPHQTVLSNVELALTLSGVSKAERRRRAVETLNKVGLGDQLNKKPTQMSGGQMQRVAIARALVNDPDILLADEPTGALDSETSVQIMEILKEISKDKLIIMVTHNGQLAEQYANRIIKLLDGRITDDSNPYKPEQEEKSESDKKKKDKYKKKTSMSFFTALSLSFNNLLTKKARTFLTAFAGSIGIIGIALILSVSNGFQIYIDRMQEDTLSSYPLSITEQTADLSALMEALGDSNKEEHEIEEGTLYSNDIMSKMITTLMASVSNNDLNRFKGYIDDNYDSISSYVNDIVYGYDIDLNLYSSDYSNGVVQVNPVTFLYEMLGINNETADETANTMMMSTDVWTQMLDNKELLNSQFDVIAGTWPESKNEVVLVVDENNEIMDYTLYALGLKSMDELKEMTEAIQNGDEYTPTPTQYSYDDILNKTYKLVLSTDYYEKSGSTWVDKSEDEEYMKNVLDNAEEIKIVGIIRPAEGVEMTSISGSVGYTKELTEYIIKTVNDAEIVKEQKENPDIDVFTGKEFAKDTDSSAESTTPSEIDISALPQETQAYLATLSEEERAQVLESYSPVSSSTYEGNLKKLGVVDLDTPSSINIYPRDFDSKEQIVQFISDYNDKITADGNEEYTIKYTDYVGLMMSSISTVIDTISYVLIAFVGISLVVSSIMIGIITYVSVLERTKEIGILKSIGASKKDISRVFNAETLIVGFAAGMFGIIVTLLLTLPINAVLQSITGIANVAQMPIVGAIILILLSMALTLIAGLIPSKIAARKDPVVALRSE